MSKSQETLKDFFDQKLNEQGVEIDDVVLDNIIKTLSLKEGEPDDNSGSRASRIQQDKDGNVKGGLRLSHYNLLRISFWDLVELMVDEANITMMGGSSKWAIFIALFALIKDFAKHSFSRLDKEEAKLLLAICLLEKKKFEIEEVQEKYQEEFEEAIPLSTLQKRLEEFVDNGFLRKREGDPQYRLSEYVSYDKSE